MSEIEQLQQELESLRRITPKRANPHAAFEQMLSRVYEDMAEIREMLTPEIRLELPAVNAPDVTVNVPAAEVRVAAAEVIVPDQSEALRLVASALASVVEIIGAWYAHETAPDGPSRKEVTFKRNGNGQITGATVTEA